MKRTASEESFYVITSKLSYSLYLVHILVIIAVNMTLSRLGVFDQAYGNPFIIYPIYVGLYYAVAWVTYNHIEKPFLSLREKPLTWAAFFKAGWFSLLVCAYLIFFA